MYLEHHFFVAKSIESLFVGALSLSPQIDRIFVVESPQKISRRKAPLFSRITKAIFNDGMIYLGPTDLHFWLN